MDGVQDLQQWLEAHAAEEGLEAEIPAMESLLTQFVAIRQQMEKSRNERGDALKAEGRAARVLRHAEASVQKARLKADRLKDRKADRDGRLLAVYEGETEAGLKAGIDHGKQKLAACKALIRIGRKAAAFKNVPEELAENHLRIADLTQSISLERSGLNALEGQIRQRDTIRRFDPYRGSLQSGKPCPLCGASDHPFLDEGGIDFTELDRIIGEREEKIRALQLEREPFQTKALAIQARAKTLEELQQAWASACGVIGEEWAFGETTLPSERIRTVRKEIRSARSKKRSTWWYVWRAKRTDRVLGRKLEKLTKQEKLLAQARNQHEPCQKALAQIDHDLNRLGENEDSVRSELSERLQRWHEPAAGSGGRKIAGGSPSGTIGIVSPEATGADGGVGRTATSPNTAQGRL